MDMKRVLICDDEESQRESWAAALRLVPGFPPDFDVRVVPSEQLKEAIHILRNRKMAAGEQGEVDTVRTIFDSCHILIIDYDLFEIDETGEEVAYLVRCFSDCGVIVGVNQFVREGFTFDLTLRGHPESFADVNLLASQLCIPGLWSTPWEGFRPWYWPLLPNALSAFEQRVDEIEGNLDRKILDFLEIPDRVSEILPIDALEFISSKEATFKEFVEKSGHGLRGRRERAASDKAIARIAAARLSKWLERLVLPGQNILVDAPHLIERYPSLFLATGPEHIINWQSTHKLLKPDQGVIDVATIDAFRFEKTAWLSRSAWYWPLVSECEKIAEVVNPWSPRQEFAFCEDTCKFALPDDGPAQFVAKVDSPFVRRFVSQRDPMYGPQLQYAI